MGCGFTPNLALGAECTFEKFTPTCTPQVCKGFLILLSSGRVLFLSFYMYCLLVLPSSNSSKLDNSKAAAKSLERSNKDHQTSGVVARSQKDTL